MAGLITRPVFWVIMTAIWSLVFPLITGAYNSVYANTIEAASITAERFDRVIPRGTDTTKTAEDIWQARTATESGGAALGGSTAAAVSFTAETTYKVIKGTDNACKLGSVAAPSSGSNTLAASQFYTPSGNIVRAPAVTVASTASAADITIANCEWKARSPIFGVFNGFVRVLLQMLALAAPLGFMLSLAYFGSMLVSMGAGNPILQVVMTVVLVLIGAILLNIVLPYISGVFYSIDGERFIVFDQELGLVAGLLKNFFGVILVSGIIGAAWSIIGQMRGGSQGGRSAFAGSGM